MITIDTRERRTRERAGVGR